jgi:hypothetical protein
MRRLLLLLAFTGCVSAQPWYGPHSPDYQPYRVNPWATVQRSLGALLNPQMLLGVQGGSGAAKNTFTLAQTIKYQLNCVASCAVPVASTGSGHIIVALGQVSANVQITMNSTPVGGGTYTHCPSGAAFDSVTLISSDCWYTLSSSAGVTTVTCKFSASGYGNNDCYIFEIAPSGTASYDISGSSDVTPSCSSCVFTALSLSGTNDAIVQGIRIGRTAVSVNSPWSSNAVIAPVGSVNDAVAISLAASAGTAPTWTYNIASTGASTGIAFK